MFCLGSAVHAGGFSRVSVKTFTTVFWSQMNPGQPTCVRQPIIMLARPLTITSGVGNKTKDLSVKNTFVCNSTPIQPNIRNINNFP